MKYFNCFMPLFILFPSFILSQEIIQPNWMKIDSVGTNGNSEAWGIDIDQQGEIFWAVNNNQANQGLDIHCFKFDLNGTPLWSNPLVYGGSGAQQSYVCNAQDDHLYIGGRLCSGLVNTCDMLLLKVDKSTGNLIWDKSENFDANGYDEVDGLEIREDGIYCGGWSQELNSAIYQSDIGLWKLDFDGNTEWTSALGLENTAEHQDGHFVVDENNIYAAGLWGGDGIANLYNGHSFIGKFDKDNGSLIDSTLFGHQSFSFNDIENALGMTSDGEHLYVTGYTTPAASNDWQIFVAKFDKDLNQLWFVDWGGSGTESARGIVVNNGKIYVAGLTESGSILTGGDRDALLLTLDTDGNILNYQTYGETGKESFRDLAVQGDHVLLTGVSELNGSNKSFLLAMIDPLSTSVESNTTSNTYKIYPNPTSGIVNIDFNENHHDKGTVQVFDFTGQLIFNKVIDSETKNLQLPLKANGSFFIQIAFPDYSVSHRIINGK